MGSALVGLFRPTRRRVVAGAVLAVCFSVFAYSLSVQRYGPEWRECAVLALVPALSFASSLDLTALQGGWPFFVVVAVLELAYCYLIVCLLEWFLGWIGFLRPTRKRIIWTAVVGLPLMVFGAVLLTVPHPTSEAELLGTILVPSQIALWPVAGWGLPIWLLFVLAWLLNFLYYYVLVCLISTLALAVSAPKGEKAAKSEDNSR